MSRSCPKPRKGKSRQQLAALKEGRDASRKTSQGGKKPFNSGIDRRDKLIQKLKDDLAHHKKQLALYKNRYYSERRRSARLTINHARLKADCKGIKGEAQKLRETVRKVGDDATRDREEMQLEFAYLKDRVRSLEAGKRELQRDRTILRKRNARMRVAQEKLKGQVRKHPRKVRSMVRGSYSRQFRAMARYLASTGMAESKVGESLREIAGVFGTELDRTMSRRTVQRCIKEGGVAADLQLVYEMTMTSKLCYSSDSTSHKRIEYESRHIAMKVVDYTDPSAEPQWQLRSLGVDTSVDHTSETQMAGLRARLRELEVLWNSSPLAKRTGRKFTADDFVYKLIGTTGDHAADQKKSHRMLVAWKMEVIFLRMGEEALFSMDNLSVVSLLLALSAKQVDLVGGQEVWNRLGVEERSVAQTEVVRQVGKQVFENLPDNDQLQMSRCIRGGCFLHKDLNCFKAGDKAMQACYATLDIPPPRLLANKQNAAVLEGMVSGGSMSKDQERALESSKRGGSKLAELGGMICKNSDTKKGQQDLYRIYMKDVTGVEVPYPEVSKTRYGSVGEAAGTMLQFWEGFVGFAGHIRDAKDRPGHTNIEKNFAEGLQDIPTLTELAVLAIYSVAMSRPFMRHARLHDNLLELEPFVQHKRALLDSIVENPHIWTRPGAHYSQVYVDKNEPDERAIAVFAAVHKLAPKLPNLDTLVVLFARASREALEDRFMDEFKEGGGIDTLTAEERKDLFIPSTNDANEGALGAWRVAQRHRAAETLHKFNSGKQAAINKTESFISAVLTEEEDHSHLRRTARLRDESKLQSKIKLAQIEADKKKAAENREREAARLQVQQEKTAEIARTGEHLVLGEVEISKLSKDELNRQLDYHRSAESGIDMPKETRIPAKSNMSNNSKRIEALLSAVQRYKARIQVPEVEGEGEGVASVEGFEREYEFDYHDDHF